MPSPQSSAAATLVQDLIAMATSAPPTIAVSDLFVSGGSAVAWPLAFGVGQQATNVDEDSYPAGRYRLTLSCVGTGHALAIVRVGPTLELENMTCQSLANTATYFLASSGGTLEFDFIGIDGGLSAIAYQLSRG